MFNIKALRQELRDLTVRNRGLASDSAISKRELTSEENREFEANSARLHELESQIKITEAVMDQERRTGKHLGYEPEAEAGRFANSPPSSDSGLFSSFGEFLQVTRDAGTPGRQTDPRLFAAASGLGVGMPADGGFLVEQGYSRDLLQKTFDGGAILSRVRRLPVGAVSNSVKLPVVDESSRATGSRWGGIRVYRLGEADLVTGSKPKIGTLEVNLKKLVGLCYATDELLQDAALLETVITEGFQQEFTFSLEDEVINGDGASQLLGILNAPALVTVAKESGQTAKTLVFENIVNMWARLPSPSKASAVWFINGDVEPQLFTMGIVVGVGGTPAFLPAGAWSGQPFNTIFGRPVVPVEYCPTLGTKGDVILADLSQYLLAEKGGMVAASSIHVRFLYDELAFRFVMRNDGMPICKTARTPYKGTSTVSPFVTLATRA